MNHWTLDCETLLGIRTGKKQTGRKGKLGRWRGQHSVVSCWCGYLSIYLGAFHIPFAPQSLHPHAHGPSSLVLRFGARSCIRAFWTTMRSHARLCGEPGPAFGSP
ncbi:hypothetical protein VTK26DRAFT_3168 [Humicola hyalothermophila]